MGSARLFLPKTHYIKKKVVSPMTMSGYRTSETEIANVTV